MIERRRTVTIVTSSTTERRHAIDLAALTALLAPALPYLVRGAGVAAEEAGKLIGADAWGYAKRVWAKLSPTVEERPAAREAVADAAEHPEDERTRAVLEWQLQKILDEDEALARAVAEIVEQAKGAGVVAAGARSIAVGGNAQGIFVAGDQNVLRE